MKVSIIEPVGGHGGMDYYDFSLCKALIDAGVAPILYTCDKTSSKKGGMLRVVKAYRGVYGRMNPVWRGFRYLRGTIFSLTHGALRGSAVSHFHLFHIGPLEAFNVLCAKIAFSKVVVTAHDVESFKKGLSVGFLVSLVYRLSDAVIAHNEVSKRELIDKLNVPTKKIHVVRHGNYISDVGEQIWSQVRTEPQSELRLLFFGQIKEVKGLDLLLRALSLALPACDGNISLTIAGKVWKDDFAVYAKIIEDLDLKGKVRADIRYIPDDEVAPYYLGADLVVLPYRKIYQSGVVLMAMSYGVPTLVSNIPGMTEVVEDGETGLVFNAGDVQDLARNLIRAYEDRDLLRRVGARGRAHVEGSYDWGRVGRDTAEVYRSLF